MTISGRLIWAGLLLAGLCLGPAGPATAEDQPTETPPTLAPAVESPAAKTPEEQPWAIQAVDFLGLETLGRQQLLEVMETRPAASLLFSQDPRLNPGRLERDRRRLERLYQEFGFFDTQVSYQLEKDEAARKARVIFTIQENRPTLVEGVEFILPPGPEAEYWRRQLGGALKIRAGQRFTLREYKDAKEDLRAYLGEQAHPKSQVVGQVRVLKAQARAVIVFRVDPGPHVSFGPSRVEGAQGIDHAFILQELVYARGQPFSSKLLEQSQRALMDTGFFASVTITPDLDNLEDGQAPMIVRVVEAKSHTVRLGLGWGNEDLFRFRIAQVNRNMLGLHDTLTFEGKVSSIYYGLTGRLKLPYVVNHDSVLLVGSGVEQKENQAFTNRRYFVSPVLEYRLPGRWYAYLGYNAEINRMSELKAKVPDADQERQQINISSVPVGLRFDNRDSVLDPKKGVYFNVEVETASSALGSDVKFCRPVVDLRHVMPLPLFPGWFLASRAKAGAAFHLPGTERIPLVRRFFLGGADSVRGYSYQGLGPLDSAGKPLGGEAMVEGSVEARFPLWGKLGGVLFVDMGNAYETLSTDVGKLRFTSGTGLRYNTPVGPIRLDVGYQLNPPSQEGLDHYEVYLSVGQAF